MEKVYGTLFLCDMFLIYNCGYYLTRILTGSVTKKKYVFKKRFATEVDNKDAKDFLKMTSKDIPWCPTNDKSLPPFMTLEDWCAGKEGRFDYKPFKVYNPEEYKKLFTLK